MRTITAVLTLLLCIAPVAAKAERNPFLSPPVDTETERPSRVGSAQSISVDSRTINGHLIGIINDEEVWFNPDDGVYIRRPKREESLLIIKQIADSGVQGASKTPGQQSQSGKSNNTPERNQYPDKKPK